MRSMVIKGTLRPQALRIVSDEHRATPVFTRRHYRKIAEALASDKPIMEKAYKESDSWVQGAYSEWSTTCLAFVKMLAVDNPRFDREKFLVWCNTTI